MLFFYSQFQVDPDKKQGEPGHITPVVDFFDPEMVGFGRLFPDGSMVVILKDGHHEEREIPDITKNGVQKTKKINQWVTREVRLLPQDALRLRAISEIRIEEAEARELLGLLPQTQTQDPGKQESLILSPEEVQN